MTLIDVNNFVVSDVLFKENAYSGSGVRFLSRRMVKIKAIRNDSKMGNSVRLGGMSEYGQHVDDLERSYQKGVDPRDRIPIIKYMDTPISLGDGTVQEYTVVDGHHRLKALDNIGVNEYPCDVYEFDDDISMIHFQIQMNDHNPSKSNTDNDIVTIYSHLIKERGEYLKPDGTIDEDNLQKDLASDTKLRRNTKKMEKMISKIMSGSGALSKHKNYTDKSGINWIATNMPRRVLGSKGGDLWIFKTGTWERTYQRMKRAIYNERGTGFERIHDIILNVEVLLHGDVTSARNKLISDIERAFEVDCFITNGHNEKETMNKFFRISYALPQIHGQEDMNKVVDL